MRGANGRCNQENLIEQLKNGARAMEMPVGNLVSNGAYMVMASLAWTLKAWLALGLPEDGRWQERRRAEKQAALARGDEDEFGPAADEADLEGGGLLRKPEGWV